MNARTIEVSGVSEGWVGACATLLDCPHHETTHLVTRMLHPLPENPAIRARVDALLRAAGHQDVQEVANTIFPAALAEDYPEPSELAACYLEDYEVLRRLGSLQGTYFGRICSYPNPGASGTSQLAETVTKLRAAREGRRWRARYQINIYAGEKDISKQMGFPCMAHLAFQLGGDGKYPERLDCLALYRNQDMIRKGYGNLLGLAQLQSYVATATGFQAGELTVIAGHADMTLDKHSRSFLQRLIGREGG
ncbi:MAG: thymidylate synthase [Solirubrobacteraceae bacterium]